MAKVKEMSDESVDSCPHRPGSNVVQPRRLPNLSGWDLHSPGPVRADSVKVPRIFCSHAPWNSAVSLSLLKGKIATFLPYQAMQHLFQFINYFPAKWEDFGLLEMKFLLSTAASGMCFCGASCAKAQDLLSFVIKPLWYGECAEGVEWEQSSCQRYQSQLFHI